MAIGNHTSAITISIPNDTMAEKFFLDSQWNWKNLKDYQDLQNRIKELDTRRFLLLERGNEEGSYSSIYLARGSTSNCILLTNYSSAIREQRYIREVPVACRVVEGFLGRLDKPIAVSTVIPAEDHYVEDGSAFYLSWGDKHHYYRVRLFESFVGQERDRSGDAQVDHLLGQVNSVIQDLYMLVEQGQASGR